MIDIYSEKLVDLADAPQKLPGSPSHQTVYRWCELGCRALNGQLVFLEFVKIGRKRYTSVEAFERFCNALSAHFD